MDNLKSFENHITALKEKKGEWIAKAVEGGKGKLRAELGIKKGETLTKSRINKEIHDLEAQDKDPETPGTQLPPAKAKKFKRLNLAKNLMGLKEEHEETKNYMFFQNVYSICQMCQDILEMDSSEVDQLLEEGHGWATDHVATSKDDIEEVFNFLRSSMGMEDHEEENHTGSEDMPELVIADNQNC